MLVLVADFIICLYQMKKSKIKYDDDDENWHSKNKFRREN